MPRPPVASFEEVTNRTRRSEDEDSSLKGQLHEVEDYDYKRHLREVDEEHLEELEDITGDGYDNRTSVWDDIGDSEFQGYNILKPDSDANCELISCVTSSSTRDVACLDLRTLNMSAGAFSSTVSLVPLQSKM